MPRPVIILVVALQATLVLGGTRPTFLDGCKSLLSFYSKSHRSGVCYEFNKCYQNASYFLALAQHYGFDISEVRVLVIARANGELFEIPNFRPRERLGLPASFETNFHVVITYQDRILDFDTFEQSAYDFSTSKSKIPGVEIDEYFSGLSDVLAVDRKRLIQEYEREKLLVVAEVPGVEWIEIGKYPELSDEKLKKYGARPLVDYLGL